MISSIGQEAASTSTSAAESAAQDPGAAANADFQTFLSLLTAQLRNQDPLQPLDSTEFVAQLASFSAVEQQIETNTKLDALVNALSGDGFDSAVHWIAKDVEVQTPTIAYDGQNNVLLRGDPPAGATSGELLIADSSGAVIKTLPVGIGLYSQSVTWNGSLDNGTAALAGTYQVSIAWKNGKEALLSNTPLIRDRVNEVRFDQENDTIQLTLASGLVVPVDAIKAIMQPEPGAA